MVTIKIEIPFHSLVERVSEACLLKQGEVRLILLNWLWISSSLVKDLALSVGFLLDLVILPHPSYLLLGPLVGNDAPELLACFCLASHHEQDLAPAKNDSLGLWVNESFLVRNQE